MPRPTSTLVLLLVTATSTPQLGGTILMVALTHFALSGHEDSAAPRARGSWEPAGKGKTSSDGEAERANDTDADDAESEPAPKKARGERLHVRGVILR
jgi:hypothetical protein